MSFRNITLSVGNTFHCFCLNSEYKQLTISLLPSFPFSCIRYTLVCKIPLLARAAARPSARDNRYLVYKIYPYVARALGLASVQAESAHRQRNLACKPLPGTLSKQISALYYFYLFDIFTYIQSRHLFCIQDTLSSRTALGMPRLACLYAECVARAKVSCIQALIIHHTYAFI